MAYHQLPFLYTSLFIHIYAINGQNTTVLNTTMETTHAADEANSFSKLWENENVLVIFGAAAVTLAFFLCLTLSVLYGVWNRRRKRRMHAHHSKQNSARPYAARRNPQAPSRKRNKRNKNRQQEPQIFNKQQMQQLARMASEQSHRKDTNFSHARHISAYNALQFAPPMNHAGDEWKRLDHVNSNHRLMQMMHKQMNEQMHVNQSAAAMDYFLRQQHDYNHIKPEAIKVQSYSHSMDNNSQNSGKYSPYNGKFGSANSGNSAALSNVHSSPALNNVHLAPSSPHIGEIDEEVIANSGELPDSVRSASILSEGPKDAFKFKKNPRMHMAQNHVIVLEEENEMKMDPIIKRREQRKKRMAIDNAPSDGSGVVTGGSESVASIRDKIEQFQSGRVQSGSEMSMLPDLPESSLRFNFNQ